MRSRSGSSDLTSLGSLEAFAASIKASNNQAPIISQGNAPISKIIDEDILASWSTSELNATDTDSDASTLSWSVTESPTNGTVTIDGSGSSPSTFTYQPNSNYFGSDTFTVQVSDGLANDSIAVNLTINPIDDPAIIIGDLNKTIQEDNTASGTTASDIGGLSDGSYYLISSSPGNGNASIDQSWHWTYAPNFFMMIILRFLSPMTSIGLLKSSIFSFIP